MPGFPGRLPADVGALSRPAAGMNEPPPNGGCFYPLGAGAWRDASLATKSYMPRTVRRLLPE